MNSKNLNTKFGHKEDLKRTLLGGSEVLGIGHRKHLLWTMLHERMLASNAKEPGEVHSLLSLYNKAGAVWKRCSGIPPTPYCSPPSLEHDCTSTWSVSGPCCLQICRVWTLNWSLIASVLKSSARPRWISKGSSFWPTTSRMSIGNRFAKRDHMNKCVGGLCVRKARRGQRQNLR